MRRFADPAWRGAGLEQIAGALRDLLRRAEPGSDRQLASAQAFAGAHTRASERSRGRQGTRSAIRRRGNQQARAPVGATFTVRRVSFGIGVERIFPINSPMISAIEVLRPGRVRRARLYYLRGLKGKAARIKRVERQVGAPAAVAAAASEPKGELTK